MRNLSFTVSDMASKHLEIARKNAGYVDTESYIKKVVLMEIERTRTLSSIQKDVDFGMSSGCAIEFDDAIFKPKSIEQIFDLTRFTGRPAAHADLSDIWSERAFNFGMSEASKYIDGLLSCLIYSSLGNAFHKENPLFSPKIHMQRYGVHLLFFRIEEKATELVRVLYINRGLLSKISA